MLLKYLNIYILQLTQFEQLINYQNVWRAWIKYILYYINIDVHLNLL